MIGSPTSTGKSITQPGRKFKFTNFVDGGAWCHIASLLDFFVQTIVKGQRHGVAKLENHVPFRRNANYVSVILRSIRASAYTFGGTSLWGPFQILLVVLVQAAVFSVHCCDLVLSSGGCSHSSTQWVSVGLFVWWIL